MDPSETERERLFCCYPSCRISFWVLRGRKAIVCPYCQRSSKLVPYPCGEDDDG